MDDIGSSVRRLWTSGSGEARWRWRLLLIVEYPVFISMHSFPFGFWLILSVFESCRSVLPYPHAVPTSYLHPSTFSEERFLGYISVHIVDGRVTYHHRSSLAFMASRFAAHLHTHIQGNQDVICRPRNVDCLCVPRSADSSKLYHLSVSAI